ncbi:VCBS domain-containing protein [Vibrio sp. 10N.286.49.B3]|uniref:VCBS domain-containing protein n=1 Tax=Vibrio sp. 10N.286.49.B3 TaxID=1880855 RepID=UPI002410EAF0|nr:VCBS domain-containing protein [Vibrio sp. 10N.286.49.B3]
MSVTDIDNDDVFVPVVNFSGNYGTFNIDALGVWTFVADQTFDYLNTDDAVLIDTFTVQSQDGTQQQITVKITGTNDMPVADVDIGQLGESDDSITVNVLANDTDVDDVSLTLSNVSIFSVDGSLTNILGSVEIVNNEIKFSTDDQFEFLNDGDSVEVVINYQVDDGHGGFDNSTLTLTVNGENDIAVIDGLSDVTLSETDEILSTSGKLNVTDLDNIEEFIPQPATASRYGVFSIDALGSWTFIANESFDELNTNSDPLVSKFTVVTTDGTAKVVSITIEGTNDAPIAFDSSESTQENQILTSSLPLATDIDGAIDSYQLVSDVPKGKLTLKADGSFDFDPQMDFDHLDVGVSEQVTFTYTATDNNGALSDIQTVTITVIGQNDAPHLILGDKSGDVVEDSIYSATGTLTAEDVDDNASHTWRLLSESDSEYGMMTMSTVGTWVYQIDNVKAQELANGETRTETFKVEVSDGLGGTKEQDVVITITGTNDDPVILGESNADGVLVEDLVLTADGTLIVNDVDLIDEHIWSLSSSTQGLYGSITVDQNGKWIYTLDPDKSQHLEQNVIYDENIFTIKVDDQEGGTDTFDINIQVVGQNDSPLISGVTKRVVTEDIRVSKSGQLETGDPDDNEAHVWSVVGSAVGNYGSISVNQKGKWTYTLEQNDAQIAQTQALENGQREVEVTFTIQVVDRFNQVSTQDIKIIVKGTNDRPEITGDLGGNIQEDGFPNMDPSDPITTAGQLDDNDIDTNDLHIWTVNTTSGKYGSIVLDKDTGAWVYTLDNNNSDVQGLLVSEDLTDRFVVNVKDDSGDNSTNKADSQVITITIQGSNDVPTLSGETAGSVIEAEPSKQQATGLLVVADLDVNDDHQWSVIGEDAGGISDGVYGTLEIDDNGEWTYNLDSTRLATLTIPPGETAVDTFQVEVIDIYGDTAIINVNISVAGSNTTPDIQLEDSYSIVEDAAPNTIMGTFDSGDPDRDDILTWEVVGSSGTYGELILQPDGNWVYTLDNSNSAVNQLDVGDNDDIKDSIDIKVTDQHGAVSIKTVVIDILGANDTPSIGGALSKTIAEDTAAITGQLQTGDPDSDDTHTWALANGVGLYGTFILDSTGKWTYLLDNDLDVIQKLNPTETLEETFSVSVVDSHGELSSDTVTVTIQGTNDLPTVSGDISGTYVENQASDTVTGKLTLDDVDNDEVLSVVEVTPQNAYQGNYGTFSIDSDGNWTFTANTTVLEALAEGDVRTESFQVVGKDNFGGTILQDVIITIEGVNDIPVITGASTGTVVEDSADLSDNSLLTASGQLLSSDVDNNSSTVSWAIEDGNNPGDADYGIGQYGVLTLANNGEWTYVLDNTNPAVQALSPGEMEQETFYVTVTDNDGGTSEQKQIVIDVLGWDNDGSGGSGNFIGTVKTSVREDGDLIQSAEPQEQILSNLINGEVIKSATFSSGGSFGTLVDDPANGWTYVLNNDSPLVQGLKNGDVFQESVRVQVDTNNDGSSDGFYTVNVTIAGTNDKPEITIDDVEIITDPTTLGETIESVVQQISGVLGVNDPDFNETHTWSIDETSGTYGDISLNSQTGEWEYLLSDNDAVSALDPEEEVFDTFTITVTDITGLTDTHEVNIKVIGSPEDTTLDNIVILELEGKEDTPFATSGTYVETGVLDSPEDLGNQPTWSLLDGVGNYGDIIVNSDGSWEYTLDNDSPAVQSIAEGEVKEDVFLVYVVDQYGKTVVDANGDPEQLALVVKVTGTNDAPDISGALTGAVDADNTSTITGQLTPGDVDIGDSHTWSAVTIPGMYGVFVLGADGEWTYDVDETLPAVIALNGRLPETLQETFPVTVTDGSETSTKDVTITINGVNETPTITGDVTALLSEDGVEEQTMQLNVSDVDNGDVPTFDAKDLQGTYGQFSIDEAGEWTYTIDNDADHIQALPEGQSVSETFIVSARDELGASVTQQVTVTIDGTNDIPTLSGEVSGVVQEESGSSVSGALAVLDVDIGDTATYEVVAKTPNDPNNPTLGTLSVDDQGLWTYVVIDTHPIVEALGVGESTTDTVQVIAIDGSGEATEPLDITITITGTNDAPAIEILPVQDIYEDTQPLLSGTLDDGDVDVDDTHLWEIVTEDPRGTLTLDAATGDWNFELDNDLDEVQQLAIGESFIMTYTVKVTDEHGESSTEDIQFKINGTNDIAEVVLANSNVTGAVVEDGTQQATGNITVTDVDTSDTHAFKFADDSQVSQSTYGALTVDRATGNWTYDIDNAMAQEIPDGQVVTEVFTIQIDDSDDGLDVIEQQVTITITGTNDSASITGELSGDVLEDSGQLTLQTTGQLLITDVDLNEEVFDDATVTPAAGVLGSLTINSDGVWVYSVDNSAIEFLGDGKTKLEIFTIQSVDGTTKDITVTLTGTNNSAVIGGAIVGDVQESDNLGTLTETGSLTITDIDLNEASFNASVTPAPDVLGSLTIDSSGNWSYSVANSDVEYLKDGEVKLEVFTVSAFDGTAQDITVTLTGINNSAIISGDITGELVEGDNLTTLQETGSLSVTDADLDQAVFDPNSVTPAAGVLGTLLIDSDGNWTYSVANNDVQYLVENETKAETFTVQTIDGTPQNITVTLTGINNSAVIGGDVDGSVQEDDSLVTLQETGSLTITDADANQAIFDPNSVTAAATTLGSLTIESNGDWTYSVANSAVEYLAAGDVKLELFTVQSIDGTPQVISVDILGTNEAPIISGVIQGDVQEDFIDSVSGQVTATDVEMLTSELSWSLASNAAGTYGNLAFNNQTGAWTYTLLAGSTLSIAAGSSADDVFTVQVYDGIDTVTEDITITVLGNYTLQGTNSIDILVGTSEDELIWGDPVEAASPNTADTFSWSLAALGTASDPGHDVIKDFEVGVDSIDLQGVFNLTESWDSSVLADQVVISEADNEVVISLNNLAGDLLQDITLQGITLTDLFNADVSTLSDSERLSLLVESEQLILSDTFGHEGDDNLVGTTNNDIFEPDSGNDILVGNGGEDIFIFHEIDTGIASKVVSDFDVSDDILDISELVPDVPTMATLLDRIDITVDENDPSNITTTIDIEDNSGGQTHIVLEGVGWSDFGYDPAGGGTPPDTSDLLTIMQDQLNMLKVSDV